MRILFTRFPLESAYGGAEIQTLSLMEGLAARGHAVAFAGSCPVLLEECTKRGIPAAKWHIGAPPVTKYGALSFAWRRFGMKQKLMRLLDQFHDLDAIAMLSLSEKLLLTDVAAARGVRPYWIEHDRVGPWLTRNPWLAFLLRQSTQAVTIAVSDLSRTLYLALGWMEERTVAIPNGIDESQHSAPARKPIGNRDMRLGCVARLSREKGVDVLIEAMTRMPANVSLTILGKGRERSALERLIGRRALGERVHIVPSAKDMPSFYASIDALVLPSRDNDPFGLAAAEAMLLGLPVIVTDACGIAGYLEHGKDALIARADSAASLADAIARLPAMAPQLAQSGQATAREKFSAKKMVTAYESLFTDSSLFS